MDEPMFDEYALARHAHAQAGGSRSLAKYGFWQVGFEPGQIPTALKPAFDLGF